MVGAKDYQPHSNIKKEVGEMARKKHKTTLREQNQAIVNEYMLEFNVEIINMDKVAAWAIETGRYNRSPKTMQQRAKEEISKSLRAERHIDPQGRTVRTMHPIKVKIEGEQVPLWVWVDIRTATRKQMRKAFSRQRQAIQRDVMGHKQNVDSFNDNNINGEQIPLFDYNFNKDVVEAELPTEYNEDEIAMDFDD